MCYRLRPERFLRLRGGGGGLAPSVGLDEPPPEPELELEPLAEPDAFPEPPELLPDAPLELLPEADRASRPRLAPEPEPESDFEPASI